MSDRYIVHKDTLEGIADKIREKKYQTNQMTPAQMIEELDELGYGMDIEINEGGTVDEWVRPVEYPDPTVIDLTDFDGVYLTYDLRKTPGYGWIGIYIKTAANADVYIERGHIADNAFVVDGAITVVTSGSAHEYYFRQELDDTAGDIQLWRLTTANRFLRISFVPNTATTAQNFKNQSQPCVERYGRLPSVNNCSSSTDSSTSSNGAWTTFWMERDDIKDAVSVTNMSLAYAQARRLREIYFDGWDTSKVANFQGCFSNCRSLRHIPLDKIDTSSANTLRDMFTGCYNLDNVSINHFNIDGVTTMYCMFQDCRTLKHLEMSELRGTGKLTSMYAMFSGCVSLSDIGRNVKNLNVENVTSLSSAFLNCYRLKSLDLSDWNTSSLTNTSSMCNGCYALEVINLTGWDMSKVTTANNMFSTCRSLKKVIGLGGLELLSVTSIANMFSDCNSFEAFKIKAWNISALTAANSLFANCYSLKTVELQGWDTSNILTTVASMFSNCNSLKKIHLPNMDFTQDVLLDTMFNGCRSLEDLDISGWHIARIRTFLSFFANCRRLSDIDITSWTVDSGEMDSKANLTSVFDGLYNCKSIKIHFPLEIVTSGTINYLFLDTSPLEHIDIRYWDLSAATTSKTPVMYVLEDYYPPKLPPVNQTYATCRNITPASLVRILEALPTISSAHTVTLGQANKLKLTAEEIAIATQKGWTVA